MTETVLTILCLIIVGLVLFKVIGFIAKFAVVVVALCMGYWYLAPQFGWPLPF